MSEELSVLDRLTKLNQFLIDSGASDAPSVETLLLWKGKYGFIRIYNPEEGIIVVYRALSRPEYLKLQADSAKEQWSDAYQDDVIASTCMLFSTVNLEQVAGLTPVIAQQVMQASMFVSLEESLKFVGKI